jgi:hypothetical protein
MSERKSREEVERLGLAFLDGFSEGDQMKLMRTMKLQAAADVSGMALPQNSVENVFLTLVCNLHIGFLVGLPEEEVRAAVEKAVYMAYHFAAKKETVL